MEMTNDSTADLELQEDSSSAPVAALRRTSTAPCSLPTETPTVEQPGKALWGAAKSKVCAAKTAVSVMAQLRFVMAQGAINAHTKEALDRFNDYFVGAPYRPATHPPFRSLPLDPLHPDPRPVPDKRFLFLHTVYIGFSPPCLMRRVLRVRFRHENHFP